MCLCVLSPWGEDTTEITLREAVESVDVVSQGTLQGCCIKTEWTLLDVAMPESYRLAFSFPDSGGGSLARVLAALRDAGVRLPSVRSKCVMRKVSPDPSTQGKGNGGGEGLCVVDAVMGLPRDDFVPHSAIFGILRDFGATVLDLKRNPMCCSGSSWAGSTDAPAAAISPQSGETEVGH